MISFTIKYMILNFVKHPTLSTHHLLRCTRTREKIIVSEPPCCLEGGSRWNKIDPDRGWNHVHHFVVTWFDLSPMQKLFYFVSLTRSALSALWCISVTRICALRYGKKLFFVLQWSSCLKEINCFSPLSVENGFCFDFRSSGRQQAHYRSGDAM